MTPPHHGGPPAGVWSSLSTNACFIAWLWPDFRVCCTRIDGGCEWPEVGLRGEDVSGLRICTPSTDEVETHQLSVMVGVDRMRQIDKTRWATIVLGVPKHAENPRHGAEYSVEAMIHMEGNVFLEMGL